MLRVYHLDRGYERLEDKLSAVGATIERRERRLELLEEAHARPLVTHVGDECLVPAVRSLLVHFDDACTPCLRTMLLLDEQSCRARGPCACRAWRRPVGIAAPTGALRNTVAVQVRCRHASDDVSADKAGDESASRRAFQQAPGFCGRAVSLTSCPSAVDQLDRASRAIARVGALTASADRASALRLATVRAVAASRRSFFGFLSRHDGSSDAPNRRSEIARAMLARRGSRGSGPCVHAEHGVARSTSVSPSLPNRRLPGVRTRDRTSSSPRLRAVPPRHRAGRSQRVQRVESRARPARRPACR